MEIIHHNATSALFRKAEELAHKPRDAWKCIYFRLPDAQDRRKFALPAFNADILGHIFARVKGHAYICDDGEVFILYKGSYHLLTTRLTAYLSTLYPLRMSSQSNQMLFSIFDLGRDWQGFYLLCEKRYVAVLAGSGAVAMFARCGDAPVSVAILYDHVAGYLK